MTAEQFDAAVKNFPRMSAEGRAAARRVLVEGVPQIEVAEDAERKRQQVQRWASAIHAAHLAEGDVDD